MGADFVTDFETDFETDGEEIAILSYIFLVVPRDPQGRVWSSLNDSSRTYPEARHALTGAVFHIGKMRARVAADARVTSGALYLKGPRRVFRGLGLGFQGLEFKQPRSGSSATPYIHPEARHDLQGPQKKKSHGITDRDPSNKG